MEMRFSIQGDSEGYVTMECPFCESEFKVRADEYQNDDNLIIELFCPYCGLADEVNSFYSSELINIAKEMAYNQMIEMVNKTFKQTSRNINSSNSMLKMDFKPLKKVTVKEYLEKDTTEEIFSCNSCERHFKVLYCTGVSSTFCPYCGGNV